MLSQALLTGVSGSLAASLPAVTRLLGGSLSPALSQAFSKAADSHHKQPKKATIGFIGLGSMGTRMAHRLLEAGHPLMLFDTNPVALGRSLAEASKAHPGLVHTAGSAAEVAGTNGVDLIITMLPNAEVVKEVYLGSEGIVQAIHGIVPHVIIDCSTTGPLIARDVATKVSKTRLAKSTRKLHGLPNHHPVMVDAPVSGSVVGATAGSLSFMVGGHDAAVHFVEPYLKLMGTHITRCGDHGDAQAAKLCSTLVTVSNMAAVAEALALAKRLGVDPKVMTEVLNSGTGRCWPTEQYNPVPGLSPGSPPSQGYKGGLRSDLVKDQLELLAEAAEAAHSPIHMGRTVQQLYTKVCDEGMGDADFAALYRFIYGSGLETDEWKSGDKLFNSHAP